MPRVLHQVETFNQPELERISDPEVTRVLRSMLVVQKETLTQVAEMKKNQEDIAKASLQHFAAAAADIERLERAFPGEDVDGHRRAHDTMIAALEERRQFWAAIREKTIAGLVWAAIVGLGLAMWHYLVDMVKRAG